MANGRENCCDRIMTGASRSEAITVGFKARFPFGFEREFDQRLASSVSHSGNAQRPLFRRRARFGYPDPSNRRGRAIEGEGLRQREAFRGS